MPPVAPLPIPSLVPPHAGAALPTAAAAQPGAVSTPAFGDRPQLAARLDALPLAGTTLGRLRELSPASIRA